MALIENESAGIVYMTAPNIQTSHMFTTRLGGVSKGEFESLNLGLKLGDDRDSVLKNYTLICDILGISPEDIVFSSQIHSARIRLVTRSDRGSVHEASAHAADGLITCDAGVALMVFTADCVPILLHDPVRGAIGAIHSGWRGTALDIAGEAVIKMSGEFGCSPADINAAIGPCISKCCYEVGSDVKDALYSKLGTVAKGCIAARGEKYMVDLKEANKILLTRAGIRNITISDECTSCRSDKYWSYRRTNGKRGSQAAIVAIRPQTT